MHCDNISIRLNSVLENETIFTLQQMAWLSQTYLFSIVSPRRTPHPVHSGYGGKVAEGRRPGGSGEGSWDSVKAPGEWGHWGGTHVRMDTMLGGREKWVGDSLQGCRKVRALYSCVVSHELRVLFYSRFQRCEQPGNGTNTRTQQPEMIPSMYGLDESMFVLYAKRWETSLRTDRDVSSQPTTIATTD